MVAGLHAGGGPGLHPPGRRRRPAHQDGPPRGRRAQPRSTAASTSPAPTTPTAARSARRAPPSPTRAPANKDGHVVEITPTGGDHTADTFAWNLFLICGDAASAGTYFGGWTGPVSPISCPDNVAFDSEGNLWVSTDGQPSAIKVSDGLFKVPVEGPERGHVQQFLAVPAGAETCGPVDPRPRRLGVRRRPAPGRGRLVGRAAVALPRLRARRRGTAAGQFAGPRPTVVQVTRA